MLRIRAIQVRFDDSGVKFTEIYASIALYPLPYVLSTARFTARIPHCVELRVDNPSKKLKNQQN